MDKRHSRAKSERQGHLQSIPIDARRLGTLEVLKNDMQDAVERIAEIVEGVVDRVTAIIKEP